MSTQYEMPKGATRAVAAELFVAYRQIDALQRGEFRLLGAESLRWYGYCLV